MTEPRCGNFQPRALSDAFRLLRGGWGRWEPRRIVTPSTGEAAGGDEVVSSLLAVEAHVLECDSTRDRDDFVASCVRMFVDDVLQSAPRAREKLAMLLARWWLCSWSDSAHTALGHLLSTTERREALVGVQVLVEIISTLHAVEEGHAALFQVLRYTTRLISLAEVQPDGGGPISADTGATKLKCAAVDCFLWGLYANASPRATTTELSSALWAQRYSIHSVIATVQRWFRVVRSEAYCLGLAALRVRFEHVVAQIESLQIALDAATDDDLRSGCLAPKAWCPPARYMQLYRVFVRSHLELLMEEPPSAKLYGGICGLMTRRLAQLPSTSDVVMLRDQQSDPAGDAAVTHTADEALAGMVGLALLGGRLSARRLGTWLFPQAPSDASESPAAMLIDRVAAALQLGAGLRSRDEQLVNASGRCGAQLAAQAMSTMRGDELDAAVPLFLDLLDRADAAAEAVVQILAQLILRKPQACLARVSEALGDEASSSRRKHALDALAIASQTLRARDVPSISPSAEAEVLSLRRQMGRLMMSRLGDSELSLRVHAAELLSSLEPNDVVPSLSRLCADRDANTRSAAMAALVGVMHASTDPMAAVSSFIDACRAEGYERSSVVPDSPAQIGVVDRAGVRSRHADAAADKAAEHLYATVGQWAPALHAGAWKDITQMVVRKVLAAPHDAVLVGTCRRMAPWLDAAVVFATVLPAIEQRSCQAAGRTDVGAAPHRLPVGARVLVQRLVAKPEYNGKSGSVLSFDEDSGRYGVALDDGKELSLRPECVALGDGDEAAEQRGELLLNRLSPLLILKTLPLPRFAGPPPPPPQLLAALIGLMLDEAQYVRRSPWPRPQPSALTACVRCLVVGCACVGRTTRARASVRMCTMLRSCARDECMRLRGGLRWQAWRLAGSLRSASSPRSSSLVSLHRSPCRTFVASLGLSTMPSPA